MKYGLKQLWGAEMQVNKKLNHDEKFAIEIPRKFSLEETQEITKFFIVEATWVEEDLLMLKALLLCYFQTTIRL